MTTSHSDQPARRDDAVVRPSSEAVVVQQRSSGREFLLNPTAFALWQLCDGQTTTEEMVVAVCRLFAVGSAEAEHDVAEAVEEMRRVGLIT